MYGGMDQSDEDNSELSEENDADFDPAEFEAEEPETNYGYGASFDARPELGKPDLELLEYISRSQYLPGILDRIERLPVTVEYKMALTDEVASLLSPETVFANSTAIKGPFGIKQDVVRTKVIDAKLRLRLTRTSATKSDLRKVSASRIESAILGVFVNYLSRSVGDKRERLIMEISSRVTNVNEQRTIVEEQAPRKKSFWLRK